MLCEVIRICPYPSLLANSEVPERSLCVSSGPLHAVKNKHLLSILLYHHSHCCKQATTHKHNVVYLKAYKTSVLLCNPFLARCNITTAHLCKQSSAFINQHSASYIRHIQQKGQCFAYISFLSRLLKDQKCKKLSINTDEK